MKIPWSSFLAAILLIVCSWSTGVAGPGGWDQTYAPTVTGGPVYATAVQTDGKLVVGGGFTSVDGSTARSHLARLFSDGSLDSTFFATGSGVSSTVWSLAVETNGSIILGGDFTGVNGTSRFHIARLNSNGTVDGSFVPTNAINNSVLAVAVQTNGAIVIGGTFSGGTFPSYNARLNADGTTDNSFSSIPNGPVYAMAVQSDGKIVIGGAFTSVNGASRLHIARLNADGSLDNAFQNGLTGASSNVRCIQIQGDGKILIGGDFTAVNGTSRGYVARLTSTGALDAGFNSSSGANNSVYALAVQSDGNVLIGGSFSSYASANLSRIARLYTDGTRDTTFTNFGINNTIQTLAVQGDGGILIGGIFTTINNTNWSFLGRLYGNLYPPEFVVQPVSRNTNVGANVTFSAQVSNPTSTSFQWRKEGVNIPGATGTSYSLFNVQFSDAGNYSVFVSDALGGTTSSNALLQVGVAPTFTSQPTNQTVAQGQSATFSVSATGTPLNYYWKKNGAFIPGQTNATLAFASVVPTNAATYTCQVSNFLGSVTSSGAVLTVTYPPTITSQPVSQTIGIGSNFTVRVTASGNPALAYQWLFNSLPLANATNSSFSVSAAQTSDAGAYSVVITNTMGGITSSVANIVVDYFSPTLVTQPASQNILVSNNFTLNASASGTAPLTWQWLKDGSPISNATAITTNLTGLATFSFTNTLSQPSESGSYEVVVTNSGGSVTSSVAVVNVGYAPVVVQQPVPVTNAVGGMAAFTCVVTGTAPISLQWNLFGNPIAGATNLTLTITNLQPASIGFYSLAATNIFGGTVSSNAALTLAGYAFNIWNGLVAYYPFNGNAADASGNGRDGAVTNCALTADRFGITNSAYQFNGSNSVIVATNAWFSGNASRSISIWADFSSLVTGDLFTFGNGLVSNTRFSLLYGNLGGPSPFFDVVGEGNDYDFPAANFVGMGWQHCVITYDGTNGILYQNGTQLGSFTAGFNTDGSYPLVIGADSLNRSDEFFNGSLDDIRVYNRALSSNEVLQLYDLEADVPVITQQPQSETVNSGSAATLSVTATAANALTYQWQFNGTPIPGATNASLTISNVLPNNIGFYTAAVSNSFVGVVSSVALLNLNGHADPTWNGLVAYYPFNGNASDASGNQNNGTPVGATLASDRFGTANAAYTFNGINNYINFASVPLTQTDNWSLAAWVQPASLSEYGQVVSMGYDDGTTANGYSLGIAGNSTTPGNELWAVFGQVNWIDGGVAFASSNQWYQVVMLRNSGVTTFFVNGVQTPATTALSPIQPTSFRIGSANGIRFFNGSIDDVRLYDRALSPGEVAYLFQKESQSTLLPPGNLSASIGSGPSLTLNFTGIPGASLVLQYATNLNPPINWQSLITNAADTNGNWQFTDTNLTIPRKFYRVTAP